MSLGIIIPARYGSTRFPGKPLAVIAGVPLLQRVWALGVSVAGKENVFVATDDNRIASLCERIGAAYVITNPKLTTGTERVYSALQQLSSSIDQVINLQGDAVLTPPWVIHAVMEEMKREKNAGIFTPAVRMTKKTLEMFCLAKTTGEVGGTTVVFDKDHNALYFSKSIIPFMREKAQSPYVFRHIGLYGYRRDTLDQFVKIPPGPLETAEKLEQLRALENGMKIRVVEVDYKGRTHTGVDSENDVRRVEAIIKTEGELLPVYDGSYCFLL